MKICANFREHLSMWTKCKKRNLPKNDDIKQIKIDVHIDRFCYVYQRDKRNLFKADEQLCFCSMDKTIYYHNSMISALDGNHSTQVVQ